MQLPSKNDLFNMYQQVSTKVKQYAKNLTPIEVKVEEATSNEPWGPHGTVMAEITRASFDFENYKQIMGVIARRLQSEGESWRHVYKSLLLLEYMCKHGPIKVVNELSSNISTVEGLERFQYKDKNSKDWGLNVRQRAKELRTLVTNPDTIQRERQKAKDNASKYTGVSSEDSRMGGFGSSSYTGFSNSSSSMGASALSKLDLGSKTHDTTSLTGFGSTDSAAVSRYDDDLELGSHQALSTDDKDDDAEESRKAVRKGAEPRRKADGGSPVRKGRVGTLKQSADAEARGPKKLSQVKVDPSIAKSLGVLPRSSTPAMSASAPPAGDSTSQTELLDVFGDAGAATPATQSDETAWGAFDGLPGGQGQPSQQAAQKEQPDDWALLLDGPNAARRTPSNVLADPFCPSPATTASAPQPQDPFALGQQATPPQEDPFSLPSQPQERNISGRLPLAPAPPQAAQDPFAILAAESPHAALAPKPHSPLKATPVKSAVASATPSQPFGLSSLNPPQASSSMGIAVPPSSKIGQALPEDMFALPNPAPEQRIRVQAGYPTTQPRVQQPSNQQSFFQQPPGFGNTSTGSPVSRRDVPEFQAFTSAPTSKDPFASSSSGTPNFANRSTEALGGGMKMAPSLPQPNMPPPVNKQDPFAGLAGF